MKNIVYLIKSTRNHLTPFPQCRIGITNQLYRQLLIHNHKWLPKDRDRQRPRSSDTPRKLGWQPMAVITGFQSEKQAQMFYSLFDKHYNQNENTATTLMRYSPACLGDKRYRYEIDQRDYRLVQLSHICRDFDDEMSQLRLKDRISTLPASSNNNDNINSEDGNLFVLIFFSFFNPFFYFFFEKFPKLKITKFFRSLR